MTSESQQTVEWSCSKGFHISSGLTLLTQKQRIIKVFLKSDLYKQDSKKHIHTYPYSLVRLNVSGKYLYFNSVKTTVLFCCPWEPKLNAHLNIREEMYKQIRRKLTRNTKQLHNLDLDKRCRFKYYHHMMAL